MYKYNKFNYIFNYIQEQGLCLNSKFVYKFNIYADANILYINLCNIAYNIIIQATNNKGFMKTIYKIDILIKLFDIYYEQYLELPLYCADFYTFNYYRIGKYWYISKSYNYFNPYLKHIFIPQTHNMILKLI